MLRLCLDFHRAQHARTTMALLAEQVWRQAGCEDPAVTEIRARTIAAGGRPADLAAALRVCHVVLAKRSGSTDPAWRSLTIATAQLEARQRRTSITPDRHKSMLLRRHPRVLRFLRTT